MWSSRTWVSMNNCGASPTRAGAPALAPSRTPDSRRRRHRSPTQSSPTASTSPLSLAIIGASLQRGLRYAWPCASDGHGRSPRPGHRSHRPGAPGNRAAAGGPSCRSDPCRHGRSRPAICLTRFGEYSATGRPAQAGGQQHGAPRLAELQRRGRVVVDEGLLDRRLVRAHARRSRAKTPRYSWASRSARDRAASERTTPSATQRSRLSVASITPQPVVRNPGSRPRSLMSRGRPDAQAAEPLHHILRNIEIGLDALDVVIVLQHLQKLDQVCAACSSATGTWSAAASRAGRSRAGRTRLPGLRDRVQIVGRAGDVVAVRRRTRHCRRRLRAPPRTSHRHWPPIGRIMDRADAGRT